MTEQFGTREIGTLYNLSMQTCVDELYSDKHYQMGFLEFVEAFARVADRVVPWEGKGLDEKI